MTKTFISSDKIIIFYSTFYLIIIFTLPWVCHACMKNISMETYIQRCNFNFIYFFRRKFIMICFFKFYQSFIEVYCVCIEQFWNSFNDDFTLKRWWIPTLKLMQLFRLLTFIFKSNTSARVVQIVVQNIYYWYFCWTGIPFCI